MATRQKRRAEEELTSNSAIVIEPVLVVPQLLQHQPTFMERVRQNVGGAMAWVATPILAISRIYTTLTHRNVDIITETHIQQATSRQDGTTSIKRRKTKRTKRSQSVSPPKPDIFKPRPMLSTQPLDVHRKGGRGEIDYTGCITDRDFEERAELFWLPPDFTAIRRRSLPDEDDKPQSQQEQTTKLALTDPQSEGEYSVIKDLEEHDDEAVFSESEDEHEDAKPSQEGKHILSSAIIAAEESKPEDRAENISMKMTELAVETMGTREEPVSNHLPSISSVEHIKTKDEAKIFINEATKGLERLPVRGGKVVAEAAGRLWRYPQSQGGLGSLATEGLPAGAESSPNTLWADSSIWNKNLQEMKKRAKWTTLEDHMVIYPDQTTPKSDPQQRMDTVWKAESEDEPEIECDTPKHEPRHGDLKPLRGILKKGSEISYGETKHVFCLTPSQQKEDEREARRIKREEAKKKAAAEARSKARLHRRHPKKDLVQPLSKKWNAIVDSVRTNPQISAESVTGTTLAFKDFITVLGNHAWLNDEIINAFIEAIVDAANKEVKAEAEAAGEKASMVPKFIAHNSFFYENLGKKGPQSTARLMKRKNAVGVDLMKVDSIFIPICRGNHWTIGTVRPCAKTIEYFDSMGGNSRQFMGLMRKWLEFHLGDAYVAEDWKEPNTRCARQNNGYDCGVFVCTNAFCVAAGLDTSSYYEHHMTQQRRNIAAVLLNGGFVGDFAWGEQGL